jgi:hypothetical protein
MWLVKLELFLLCIPVRVLSYVYLKWSCPKVIEPLVHRMVKRSVHLKNKKSGLTGILFSEEEKDKLFGMINNVFVYTAPEYRRAKFDIVVLSYIEGIVVNKVRKGQVY